MNTAAIGQPRILVYQDENCDIMVEYLRLNGFEIIESTEEDIEPKIKEANYDLCIIDHYKGVIPNNLRVLKFLRKVDKKIPAIFLSSQMRYEYIIDAFNKGADDYIIRPYNLEELICRIKALLKRCGIKARKTESIYKIGDYIFNVDTNTLTINGSETKLSNKESKTLAFLCAYKNELLPKKILMQQVWKDDNYYNKRSLDVHMCNLRNYLKMDERISIETKRGVGYSLVIKDVEEA